MIKIRLHGTPDEIIKTQKWLKNQELEGNIDILSTSNGYPDRNSKYCRQYLDIIIKEEATYNLTIVDITEAIRQSIKENEDYD